MWIELIISALCLGAALAMDAFSVSLTNGLAEPCGTKRRAALIAGIFAGFQTAMPLIGWLLVHTVATQFAMVAPAIPFVGFGILLFIGGKMLFEGIKETVEKKRAREAGEEIAEVCVMERATVMALLIQGVATSIDALSCGFDFVAYEWYHALIASGIIGVLTFGICFAGVFIGRKFGTKLAEKATIFGGAILILIALKMLILDGILHI